MYSPITEKRAIYFVYRKRNVVTTIKEKYRESQAKFYATVKVYRIEWFGKSIWKRINGIKIH